MPVKTLNKVQAKERIDKLKALIDDYRYHYHVLNESIMSEEAADSLKHELSQLEQTHPDLITSDSPSQRIAGKPLPAFKQVIHKYRMLSLNDIFNEDELISWQNRIIKLLKRDINLEFFVDIKMDGLACSLIYEDGVLTTAVTRGDGTIGEDVTLNIRTIDSVPLKLRKTSNVKNLLSGRTEVRGEIVMYKKDFDKLNKSRRGIGLAEFANPRNTAAGTIRQLDPKLVAERPLHFRGYDLIRDDQSEVKSYEYIYLALKKLGFLVNNQAKKMKSLKDIIKYADEWEEKRKSLPFNTDGLVIKVNDKKIYNELGIVGKAPRGAVAYKYAAEQATTKVKDIFISIGRTGAATPVAMLEPVKIAGSTVQMATLHNDQEVKRKDIRINDTVIVQKAGDIIPEVVSPLVKLRTGKEIEFVMPKVCPECGTTLIKHKKGEAIWRCPNLACPSRSWKLIQHYASKEALDIEGLGEKNVIALIDSNLIHDQADLYTLKKENVIKLERFADVSADKLIKAINAKKSPPLAKFIYALGIRHIGVQTAIDLAGHYKDFEKLIDAKIDDLSDIEGIGEVVAESVVEWFSEPRNIQLLKKFKQLRVYPTPIKIVSNKLSGLNFAITGSLNNMSREQAADKIRALGGTFQSTVGNETNYLIVGESTGSSKIAKAEALGTKIINEDEFLKML